MTYLKPTTSSHFSALFCQRLPQPPQLLLLLLLLSLHITVAASGSTCSYQLSSVIVGCTLDIDALTLRSECRRQITGAGPLSCFHLSFFHLPMRPPPHPCSLFLPSPPAPPHCLCNVSAVPCRQGPLTECLLCYGFIGLVCGRNLWIKVISHCSTFSQAVKLPFTFVPLAERDRERHMQPLNTQWLSG